MNYKFKKHWKINNKFIYIKLISKAYNKRSFRFCISAENKVLFFFLNSLVFGRNIV